MKGVYLINCLSSTKTLPQKLVKTSTETDPLQETVEIQLKRPRGPSFLLQQLERGQEKNAARIGVEPARCGSYKDHHTSKSQPVYRKLFSHGPHSSKNNFFEIKISQRRDWETPSMALARVNKLDRECLPP